MKYIIISALVIIILAFQFSGSSVVQDDPGKSFKDLWSKVDSLENAGQPKAALEIVEKIFKDAIVMKADAHVIKALIYKMKLTSEFEENVYEKNIKYAESYLQVATFPNSAILHSIIAEMYSRYLSVNQWTIQNRSIVDAEMNENFDTWDEKKFAQKIIEHYNASLKKPQELSLISVEKYKDILIDTDKQSSIYRPSLLDFLSFRALQFYQYKVWSFPKSVDGFLLNQPELFYNKMDFVFHKFTTDDTLSVEFQAIKTYQQLLKFKMKSKNLDALYEADLSRIQYVYQKAIISDKDNLYENYLTSELKNNGNFPQSTRIGGLLVDYYMSLAGRYDFNDTNTTQFRMFYVKAFQLAKKLEEKFPNTDFSTHLRNKMKEINTPNISINFDKVTPVNEPFIVKLNYKNIATVYSKIVSITPKELDDITEKNLYGEAYYEALMTKAKLLTKKDFKLNLPTDYQEHSTELIFDELPHGIYLLVMSNNKNFSYDSTITTFGLIAVSNLSYVTRTVNHEYQELFVLNRVTGDPVANAIVKIWRSKYNYKKRIYEKILLGTYTSNSRGYLKFTNPKKNSYETFYVDIKTENDYLPDLNNSYYLDTYHYPTEPYYSVHIFTDRAIYRPGQTVHFKILTTKHMGKDISLAKAGRKYAVKLMDANYQQVKEITLTLNDFGSASGDFILPKDLLNGRFAIQTVDGSNYIRVEEYKRPKFFVKTNPIEGNYILEDTVTITGKAESYSGASLSNVSVNYTVSRTPVWQWRYYSWMRQDNTVICNGVMKTDAQGNYTIKFKAVPDKSFPKSNTISFNYTVNVDITDLNGETQSAATYVNVAYTSMQLSTNLPQKIDKSKFDTLTINSVNFSGTFVPANGELAIYDVGKPTKNYIQRDWSAAEINYYTEEEWQKKIKNIRYQKDWTLENAKVGNKKFSQKFETGKSKHYNLHKQIKNLPVGNYILTLKSKDAFGNSITYSQRFEVFDSHSTKSIFPINEWSYMNSTYLHVGENIDYLLGTSAKRTFLFEIEQDGKIIKQDWITLNNELKKIQIPVLDSYRGNVAVHIVGIYLNRYFSEDYSISVPFDNKDLKLSFSSFRDKLLPGEKETWNMTISGYQKEKVAAEMMATMYDKSLDDIQALNWQFNIYPYNYMNLAWNQHIFGVGYANILYKHLVSYESELGINYNQLNWFGYNNFYGYYGHGGKYYRTMALEESESVDDIGTVSKSKDETTALPAAKAGFKDAGQQYAEGKTTINSRTNKDKDTRNGGDVNIPEIQIRKNFNETAFFYPDLRTDAKGNITFSFTIPEALTTWKFKAFAHTKDLSFGFIDKEVVTQKPLMVLSNPPRFFREGDEITFPATVSNMEKVPQSITVTLELKDAITNQPIKFNGIPQQIVVKPNESQSVSWNIKVPYGVQAITYKLVARGNGFSDGEEDTKPVLSNRTMVTETMPMYINHKGEKQYTFSHLLNSGKSKSIESYHVAVEFTSNPVWYAIQALPYLIEYPDECSEQLFSRFYANNFASYLINSVPIIKTVFDKWRNLPDSKTFLSNLEKNEELKNIVLNQTPWVREASDETEQKKRVAVLFDLNRMTYEKEKALKKLLRMQSPNGGWPWFDGMPDNRYITQYIVEGLGEMQKYKIIDVNADLRLSNAVKKAMHYLDDRNREDYEYLIKYNINLDKDNLNDISVHYLYTRSLWQDISLEKKNKTAFDYYYEQIKKYWVGRTLYSQGLICHTLWNTNKKDMTQKIMVSLKDRMLKSNEFGNYWSAKNFGYYWYNSDIETQSIIIQLFETTGQEQDIVDNLKIWLLKQKQTRQWKSTKATVAAVNALISTGSNWLENDDMVELKVGKFIVKDIKNAGKQPNLLAVAPEPGTGYFKLNWDKEMITSDLGNVTITKKDDGIAWGAMYWQYFDDIDKVIPAQSGLSIERKLFKVVKKKDGEALVPADEKNLIIGDKIIVRMILKTDRNLEYVHLRDLRASALEPIQQLSGYHYREGLGYYQSMKDASMDFFIDYMQKGTYVFEYPLRVTYAGDFSNGFAMIQCLYAPEFAAHSKGQRIKVLTEN